MIAGIPGTGIGGLLYLLISITIPLNELWMKLTKKNRKRKATSQNILITVSIIISLFITGWVLYIIFPETIIQKFSINGDPSNEQLLKKIFIISPFIITLATLIGVYLCMHILRFIYHTNRSN